MLKFKIYKNDILNMPETVVSGETSYSALRDYIEGVEAIRDRKNFITKLKHVAKIQKLPVWGIFYNKHRQSCSWFLDIMVKKNLGEWIEFDKEAFIPELAKKVVAARVSKTHMTKERNAKIQVKTLERFQNMTEEQREVWKQQLRAGWEKRKAKIANGEIVPKKRDRSNINMPKENKKRASAKAAKTYRERMQDPVFREMYRKKREARKIERQIEQGRRPSPQDEIPEWMKFPKGVDNSPGVETSSEK